MGRIYAGTGRSGETIARTRVVSSFFKIKAAVLYLLMGIGAFATDRDMYLAAAGPTPLRFQWDLPRLDPARLLPPLQMSDNVAATNTPAGLTAQSAPEIRKPVSIDEAQIVGTPNDGNVEMTSIEPVSPTADAQTQQNPPNQISPQMLLRYFGRNGTNEVLVPYSVDFTPPVPRRTGDSSAVYISK